MKKEMEYMQLIAIVVVLVLLPANISHSCFALRKLLLDAEGRNGQTDTMSVFVLPVFIYFEIHDIFFACGRNGLRNGLFVTVAAEQVNINYFVCEIDIKSDVNVDCFN